MIFLATVLAVAKHPAFYHGINTPRSCSVFPAGRETVATTVLMFCVDVKMEAESCDEKDGEKLAAFTVLLHGSLKVEQMVALVQLGSV